MVSSLKQYTLIKIAAVTLKSRQQALLKLFNIGWVWISHFHNNIETKELLVTQTDGWLAKYAWNLKKQNDTSKTTDGYVGRMKN